MYYKDEIIISLDEKEKMILDEKKKKIILDLYKIPDENIRSITIVQIGGAESSKKDYKIKIELKEDPNKFITADDVEISLAKNDLKNIDISSRQFVRKHKKNQEMFNYLLDFISQQNKLDEKYLLPKNVELYNDILVFKKQDSILYDYLVKSNEMLNNINKDTKNKIELVLKDKNDTYKEFENIYNDIKNFIEGSNRNLSLINEKNDRNLNDIKILNNMYKSLYEKDAKENISNELINKINKDNIKKVKNLNITFKDLLKNTKISNISNDLINEINEQNNIKVEKHLSDEAELKRLIIKKNEAAVRIANDVLRTKRYNKICQKKKIQNVKKAIKKIKLRKY